MNTTPAPILGHADVCGLDYAVLSTRHEVLFGCGRIATLHPVWHLDTERPLLRAISLPKLVSGHRAWAIFDLGLLVADLATELPRTLARNRPTLAQAALGRRYDSATRFEAAVRDATLAVAVEPPRTRAAA